MVLDADPMTGWDKLADPGKDLVEDEGPVTGWDKLAGCDPSFLGRPLF